MLELNHLSPVGLFCECCRMSLLWYLHYIVHVYPFPHFFSVLTSDYQLTWLDYISKATENSVPGVKSFSKVFRYENG